MARSAGFALVWFVAIVLILSMNKWARGHDWYTGLKNENGEICCGGSDCAALPEGDVAEVPGGYWIKSRHILVPNTRAKASREDDERYHACFWGDTTMPKCFFYPNRGF